VAFQSVRTQARLEDVGDVAARGLSEERRRADDSIEKMSQGWWRPSPGSIYPLLEELEREGEIKKRDDRRYELTEKGMSESNWPPWMGHHRPQRTEDLVEEINGYVSYLEDLSKTDRKKFAAYADQVVKLRDRLSTLVQEGGEKE